MKPRKTDLIRIGAISGLIVVVVTTLLNLTGRYTGLLPEAMDLSHLANMIIDPAKHPTGVLIFGIIFHLIGGVIVGVIYVYLIKPINIASGIIFMLGFWLFMMLVLMPLAGRGWFGLNDGVVIPISTIFLNMVFGFGMGLMAKKLLESQE